jgi:adenosylhomocysteine nucleosidase
MPSLALIAALPAELKPLVRAWQKDGDLYRGRIGSSAAVALAAGMGAAAAARACAAVLAAEPATDTLVSIGYAGSVSCGLRNGAAYAIREVIDAADGETFIAGLPSSLSPQTPRPQRLITLARVADREEKRRLAAQHQAVLVDMEAAAVARFARAHNLRFCAFKGVTDGPNDQLPDFNRFIDPQGQWCMTPFLVHTASHPASWSALWRLEKNSRGAALELANLVHLFFAGTQ